MFFSRVKLYISCHKEAILPSGDVYRPIQVGASLAEKRLPDMLYDDTGDNISDRNKRYCELTAQYWVWKHDWSEYIGFCHYRRLFSFAPERLEADPINGVVREKLTEDVCDELHLNDTKKICRVIRGADVWLTEPVQFENYGYSDLYSQYSQSSDLHGDDMLTAVAVLKELHPEFSEAADTYMNGTRFFPCNMFIMKRSVFRRYCAWLFPVLEETERRMDYTGYSVYSMRTIGHIAERMLGIFCTWLQQNKPKCRIDYLQRVFLEKTDPAELLVPEIPKVPVYRLYNPHSGEHLLSTEEAETDALESAGWRVEGVAWYAPESGIPVYRLYNPYDNFHFYTSSKDELDSLTPLGWTLDGIVTYGADSISTPVFRLFNPYTETNYHLYTASQNEVDKLLPLGWQMEGIAWYAAKRE